MADWHDSSGQHSDRERKTRLPLNEGYQYYPRFYPSWRSSDPAFTVESGHSNQAYDYVGPAPDGRALKGSHPNYIYDNSYNGGSWRRGRKNSVETDSSATDEYTKKANRRRCVVVLAVVGMVILCGAALALGIFFGVVDKRERYEPRTTTVPPTVDTIGTTLTINRDFVPNLADPLSTEYQDLAKEITDEVDASMRTSDLFDTYIGSSVIGFQPGSIEADLLLDYSEVVSAEVVEETLKEGISRSSSKLAAETNIVAIAATKVEARGRSDLGEACTTVKNCQDSNVQCLNDVCECLSDFYNFNRVSGNGGLCMPKLRFDTDCTDTYQCLTQSGHCLSGKCNCPEFFFYNSTADQCVPKVNLGQPCDSTTQCNDTTAVCNQETSTCACPSTEYQDNSDCKEKLALNVFCTSPTQCGPPGSDCILLKCQCALTKYYNGTHCLPKVDFGGSCVERKECLTIDSDCILLTCRCPLSMEYNDIQCIPTTTTSTTTTTAAPTTAAPTTAAPTTAAPTTAAPTTAAPTTAAPTTAVPTTAAPTTAAPTTAAPTTAAPTTAAPTTAAPTTAAPTTAAPTTAAPTTAVPTTAAPTTAAPTTAVPTTAAPTTAAPTTAAPTTAAPTTAAPTTSAPTTAAPTTAAPTTAAPTTAAPTTAAPTTVAPTTEAPTTAAPTTAAPTTAAPTTTTPLPTTTTMTTTTLAPDAPVEVVVNGSFSANLTFSEALRDENSTEFKEQAEAVEIHLNNQLNGTGIVKVTGFDEGSTIILLEFIKFLKAWIASETEDDANLVTATIVEEFENFVKLVIEKASENAPELIKEGKPESVAAEEKEATPCKNKKYIRRYASMPLCKATVNAIKNSTYDINDPTSEKRMCVLYNALLFCIAKEYEKEDHTCDFNSDTRPVLERVSAILGNKMGQIRSMQCLQASGNIFRYQKADVPIGTSVCKDSNELYMIAAAACTDHYIAVGSSDHYCQAVTDLEACVEAQLAIFYPECGDPAVDTINGVLQLFVEKQLWFFPKWCFPNVHLETCEFCLTPNIIYVMQTYCDHPLLVAQEYDDPMKECRLVQYAIDCVDFFASFWEKQECVRGDIERMVQNNKADFIQNYMEVNATVEEFIDSCLAQSPPVVGPERPEDPCEYYNLISYLLIFVCQQDPSEEDAENPCRKQYSQTLCIQIEMIKLNLNCTYDDVISVLADSESYGVPGSISEAAAELDVPGANSIKICAAEYKQSESAAKKFLMRNYDTVKGECLLRTATNNGGDMAADRLAISELACGLLDAATHCANRLMNGSSCDMQELVNENYFQGNLTNCTAYDCEYYPEIPGPCLNGQTSVAVALLECGRVFEGDTTLDCGYPCSFSNCLVDSELPRCVFAKVYNNIELLKDYLERNHPGIAPAFAEEDSPEICPTLVKCSERPKVCVTDKMCLEDKCCPSDCGTHVCATPIPGGTEKPGTCPRSVECSDNSTDCFDDSTCPGEEKCCDLDCGSPVCAAPTPDKCEILMDDLGNCKEVGINLLEAEPNERCSAFARLKSCIEMNVGLGKCSDTELLWWIYDHKNVWIAKLLSEGGQEEARAIEHELWGFKFYLCDLDDHEVCTSAMLVHDEMVKSCMPENVDDDESGSKPMCGVTTKGQCRKLAKVGECVLNKFKSPGNVGNHCYAWSVLETVYRVIMNRSVEGFSLPAKYNSSLPSCCAAEAEICSQIHWDMNYEYSSCSSCQRQKGLMFSIRSEDVDSLCSTFSELVVCLQVRAAGRGEKCPAERLLSLFKKRDSGTYRLPYHFNIQDCLGHSSDATLPEQCTGRNQNGEEECPPMPGWYSATTGTCEENYGCGGGFENKADCEAMCVVEVDADAFTDRFMYEINTDECSGVANDYVFDNCASPGQEAELNLTRMLNYTELCNFYLATAQLATDELTQIGYTACGSEDTVRHAEKQSGGKCEFSAIDPPCTQSVIRHSSATWNTCFNCMKTVFFDLARAQMSEADQMPHDSVCRHIQGTVFCVNMYMKKHTDAPECTVTVKQVLYLLQLWITVEDMLIPYDYDTVEAVNKQIHSFINEEHCPDQSPYTEDEVCTKSELLGEAIACHCAAGFHEAVDAQMSYNSRPTPLQRKVMACSKNESLYSCGKDVLELSGCESSPEEARSLLTQAPLAMKTFIGELDIDLCSSPCVYDPWEYYNCTLPLRKFGQLESSGAGGKDAVCVVKYAVFDCIKEQMWSTHDESCTDSHVEFIFAELTLYDLSTSAIDCMNCTEYTSLYCEDTDAVVLFVYLRCRKECETDGCVEKVLLDNCGDGYEQKEDVINTIKENYGPLEECTSNEVCGAVPSACQSNMTANMPPPGYCYADSECGDDFPLNNFCCQTDCGNTCAGPCFDEESIFGHLEDIMSQEELSMDLSSQNEWTPEQCRGLSHILDSLLARMPYGCKMYHLQEFVTKYFVGQETTMPPYACSMYGYEPVCSSSYIYNNWRQFDVLLECVDDEWLCVPYLALLRSLSQKAKDNGEEDCTVHKLDKLIKDDKSNLGVYSLSIHPSKCEPSMEFDDRICSYGPLFHQLDVYCHIYASEFSCQNMIDTSLCLVQQLDRNGYNCSVDSVMDADSKRYIKKRFPVEKIQACMDSYKNQSPCKKSWDIVTNRMETGEDQCFWLTIAIENVAEDVHICSLHIEKLKCVYQHSKLEACTLTELSGLIDPADPTAPTAPTGPADPTAPTAAPTGPADPTAPTGPADPTAPTGPADPTAPAGPQEEEGHSLSNMCREALAAEDKSIEEGESKPALSPCPPQGITHTITIIGCQNRLPEEGFTDYQTCRAADEMFHCANVTLTTIGYRCGREQLMNDLGTDERCLYPCTRALLNSSDVFRDLAQAPGSLQDPCKLLDFIKQTAEKSLADASDEDINCNEESPVDVHQWAADWLNYHYGKSTKECEPGQGPDLCDDDEVMRMSMLSYCRRTMKVDAEVNCSREQEWVNCGESYKLTFPVDNCQDRIDDLVLQNAATDAARCIEQKCRTFDEMYFPDCFPPEGEFADPCKSWDVFFSCSFTNVRKDIPCGYRAVEETLLRNVDKIGQDLGGDPKQCITGAVKASCTPAFIAYSKDILCVDAVNAIQKTTKLGGCRAYESFLECTWWNYIHVDIADEFSPPCTFKNISDIIKEDNWNFGFSFVDVCEGTCVGDTHAITEGINIWAELTEQGAFELHVELYGETAENPQDMQFRFTDPANPGVTDVTELRFVQGDVVGTDGHLDGNTVITDGNESDELVSTRCGNSRRFTSTRSATAEDEYDVDFVPSTETTIQVGNEVVGESLSIVPECGDRLSDMQNNIDENLEGSENPCFIDGLHEYLWKYKCNHKAMDSLKPQDICPVYKVTEACVAQAYMYLGCAQSLGEAVSNIRSMRDSTAVCTEVLGGVNASACEPSEEDLLCLSNVYSAMGYIIQTCYQSAIHISTLGDRIHELVSAREDTSLKCSTVQTSAACASLLLGSQEEQGGWCNADLLSNSILPVFNSAMMDEAAKQQNNPDSSIKNFSPLNASECAGFGAAGMDPLQVICKEDVLVDTMVASCVVVVRQQKDREPNMDICMLTHYVLYECMNRVKDVINSVCPIMTNDSNGDIIAKHPDSFDSILPGIFNCAVSGSTLPPRTEPTDEPPTERTKPTEEPTTERTKPTEEPHTDETTPTEEPHTDETTPTEEPHTEKTDEPGPGIPTTKQTDEPGSAQTEPPTNPPPTKPEPTTNPPTDEPPTKLPTLPPTDKPATEPTTIPPTDKPATEPTTIPPTDKPTTEPTTIPSTDEPATESTTNFTTDEPTTEPTTNVTTDETVPTTSTTTLPPR